MMDVQAIQIDKPVTIKTPWCRLLRRTTVTLPSKAPCNSVGIDPGVNFGITMLHANTDLGVVLHGTLKQTKTVGEYACIAYEFWKAMFEDKDNTRLWTSGKLIIEGAAYHKLYGQVELAEVRTGFYMAARLLDPTVETQIVPPATIRKVVFRNGTQQAMDIWPQLNHNGADSLSMALYGLT